MKIYFQQPYYLLFSLFIPIIFFSFKKEINSGIPFPPVAAIQNYNSNRTIKLIKKRLFIKILFITLLIFSMSEIIIIKTEHSNQNLLIILDKSGSMKGLDYNEKSRLDKAKEKASKIATSSKWNQIAIISFAEDTQLDCPITSDRTAIKFAINKITPKEYGDRTSLGLAIWQGYKYISKYKKQKNTIILFTDGQNNLGSISLKNLGELLTKAKIKLIVVPLGKKGPTPFLIQGPTGKILTIYKNIPPNIKLLTKLTEAASGRIYNIEKITNIAISEKHNNFNFFKQLPPGTYNLSFLFLFIALMILIYEILYFEYLNPIIRC